MNSFDNLLKTACNIKSTYLNQDKKIFNSLPEFYKSCLYCYDMTNNIRSQSFALKKTSFEYLKRIGLSYLNSKNYDDANYCFCQCLAIFKYIKSSNPKWKTDGGIKDEELQYFEDNGNNKIQNKEIKIMIISTLLNISLCELNSFNFENARNACNEVLKFDNKNIKAQ